MEKHSVARLIGAPPGYIGYEEGGQLTEKIKRKPYSVILLDEIEKAHGDVFNILLQVFEEGELTDGSGNTVSFRDAIIILTSNIGNREYQKIGKMGFSDQSLSEGKNEKVNDELKQLFSPEFLNRIDEVIFFHKLEKKHIKEIVNIMLDDINDRLEDKKIILKFSVSVKKHLIEEGFSDIYGARNLRRVIQSEIEDELTSALLSGKCVENSSIKVVMKGKSVAFKTEEIIEHEENVIKDEPADDSEDTSTEITNILKST